MCGFLRREAWTNTLNLLVKVAPLHLLLHDVEVDFILKQIYCSHDVRVTHSFHQKKFIFYQILQIFVFIVFSRYLLNSELLGTEMVQRALPDFTEGSFTEKFIE